MQNADDADAKRFLIQRVGSYLFVANDGRPFTHQDFESLCRSAASTKVRGRSIGFRGIGFKSVVAIASKIHLFSDGLAVTFSRERTAAEIPQAKNVPLVRIPHQVLPDESADFDNQLSQIQNEGYRTVFVFGELVANAIESEFAAFDPKSLLFLRRIAQLEMRTGQDQRVSVRRIYGIEGVQDIHLDGVKTFPNWMVLTSDTVSLAFARNEVGIYRLEETEAVVHVFMPTHEPTGFGIRINADLSTDPSRTRIVLDDRTKQGISAIAALISEMLLRAVFDPTTPVSFRSALHALVT